MIGKPLPRHGYTLVELAASMLIFSVLGIAAFSFYVQGVTAWHRIAGRIEVEENMRLAMDRMVREVREAYRVSSSSSNTLVLVVGENAGEVDATENIISVNVEYRLKDGQLLRARKGGTNPVAQNISRVEFECLPGDRPVTVRIKLWGMTADGEEIFLSGASSIRSEW